MVTVTIGWSLVLSLRLVEGLVDILLLEVDGFATFPFPLFGDFSPFPLPIGPLPFPPEAILGLEDLLWLWCSLQQLVVAKKHYAL